jgi:hypothetical protein
MFDLLKLIFLINSFSDFKVWSIRQDRGLLSKYRNHKTIFISVRGNLVVIFTRKKNWDNTETRMHDE